MAGTSPITMNSRWEYCCPKQLALFTVALAAAAGGPSCTGEQTADLGPQHPSVEPVTCLEDKAIDVFSCEYDQLVECYALCEDAGVEYYNYAVTARQCMRLLQESFAGIPGIAAQNIEDFCDSICFEDWIRDRPNGKLTEGFKSYFDGMGASPTAFACPGSSPPIGVAAGHVGCGSCPLLNEYPDSGVEGAYQRCPKTFGWPHPFEPPFDPWYCD